MRYKVCRANYFFREDNNSSLLVLADTSEQFLLNRSGKYMFDAILSNDQTEQAKKAIYEKYPNVDHKTIDDDFNGILTLMELYNIVEFLDVKEESGIEIGAINEDDYKKAGRFIVANSKQDVLVPTTSPEYYTAPKIRIRIMNDNEYYYGIKENGEFKCIVAISPNIYRTNVVSIVLLVFDSTLEENERQQMLEKLLKLITNSMVNPITKLRINYLCSHGDDKEPRFLASFKHCGFKQEVRLLNETTDADLVFYTKVIE